MIERCPNCGSSKHVRCCSWCGVIHKPSRAQHDHCSAKCDRDAARADKISAELEDQWQDP